MQHHQFAKSIKTVMKDRTAVLLCALALANAGTVQFRTKITSDDEVTDPKLAPAICAASNSDGILVVHEHCNQYYQCWNGKPVARHCYQDLQYNPLTGTCDWPNNVDCGTRLVPDKHEDHDNTEDTSAICASEGSEELLIAHSHCDKFYKCHEGKAVTYKCPGKLLYNAAVGYCDCASNVACGDRVTESEEETDSNNNGNDDPSQAPSICASEDSEGVLVAHENCNKFYKCNNGKPVELACYGNLVFNPAEGRCDWPDNVKCGDRFTPEKDSSENGSNENAGSEGGNTENGGSGGGDSDGDGSDNNSTENGESGNLDNETCNCDPGDAPYLCAKDESGGILVAHEKCDKFYVCLHGRPFTQQCKEGLLYNPYAERCDWPYNVKCGNRVIPKEEDEQDNGSDSNNNSSKVESGETNNSGGNDDNNSSENGSTDNGGSGICNCNPGEAPSLCAQEGSDGTLIAHEKCGKYYQCLHGVPIVKSCPSGLLYNPYKEHCDWADKVNCEDKSIPEENSAENSGPDNNNSDNEESGSADSGKGDSGNGGSDKDVSGNEDSRDDDSNDGSLENRPESGGNGSSFEDVNDDPSQAPAICSKDGSDGIFVANENCNKFYICSDGKPVVLTCPNNLLYNPLTKECDWPKNVNCGDRKVPGSSEDSDESYTSSGDEPSAENRSSESESSSEENVTTTSSPENKSSSEEDVTTDENHPESESSSEENVTTTEKPSSENESSSEVNFTTTEKNLPESEISSEENVTTTEKAPAESESSSEEKVTTTENTPESESSSEDDVTTTESSSKEDSTSDEAEENDKEYIDDSEAEQFCRLSRSNFEFKPHQECNKFYACVAKVPVVLTCPGNLLYNSQTKQCERPETVECGSRLDPSLSDKEEIEKDGSAEHELESIEENNSKGNENDGDNNGDSEEKNKSDNNNGSSVEDNESIGNNENEADGETDSDNNGTAEEQDNGNNNNNGNDESSAEDNGSDGTGNNDGSEGNGDGNNGNNANNGNNGVDSEVAQYCSVSGSDEKVLPHENCNQYYMCLGGVPVVRTCSGKFLFNPSIGLCDWPQNVNCNNQGAGGAAENGDNNSNGSDESDEKLDQIVEESSEEEEEPTNESNAVATCSLSGSNNRVIPHDNCKNYYICVSGVPQVRTCSGQFLFNPNALLCDWPQNVNCGNRVL